MFPNLPRTHNEFHNHVLANALVSLKVNNYLDNYDLFRFQNESADKALTFEAKTRVYYFNWFFMCTKSLYSAYALLSDDESKNLFLHLIIFRMVGHLACKIPVDFRNDGAYQFYKEQEKFSESTLPLSGYFGKLKHFDFYWENHRYLVDCIRLEATLFRGQYFYSKNNIVIKPEKGDFVVDGGACLGDTAIVFSNAVGESGKVYSFDPIAEHLEVLKSNAQQFTHKNVKVIPFGLSNCEKVSPPVSLGHYSPGFNGSPEMPLRSLDKLFEAGEIERVDFIKLDVEGAELVALEGGKNVIHHFKPKLAISLYHKDNDIFEIIHYISVHFPFYQFHLGHYTIHQEETVLYCIKKS